MGGCISLMAFIFFRSGLNLSGVYRIPKNTKTVGLNYTLIKIKFNTCFSHKFYCLLEISVMCFLIVKYLFIISFSHSTPATLVYLVNLPLKDVLIHPLPKGILRNYLHPRGCVEGCHEHQDSHILVFHLILKKKIVEQLNLALIVFSFITRLFNHSGGL